MSATLYDDRPCALGEGPLWHPERQQLFWFDITGQRMLSRDGDTPLEWQFDEMVSAAGWVDHDTLLIASETALVTFDLAEGESRFVAPLEADRPETRSNDGRADPWGGFWIGTMGKSAEPGAGAIYRLFDGTLRRVVRDVTISNALCFDAAQSCAYYADTPTRQVMRLPLDGDGWPSGPATVAVDLRAEGLNPDGAVTDAAGNLWIAQWGAGRVACHAPDGTFLRALACGGRHSSCPAFGGPDLDQLFITTAREGLSADDIAAAPENGCVFAAEGVARGLPEPRVIL
ncbi:SMP-30/Gluconolaconase/LRE domain protein [Dinoroseobacter shibae DFL 12 = DSM 16493]|uniref:SMP-30/Gluconolaconase/LRE domain protein n=1 Tax=Dinoroseobacter shibae (strain DSM 16493 / NCIMB 14021 / DFL 12) TaxID=398580 RepID=A8LIC8_DINSH|nr:SMP-30/gluconolactonase/LRE family protein [Dinoroseobacter shibae]ABV92982.1 SMP-30/Gluconolaconase/LRE domain protein [Dinoroseobacter shibae DFL 12 = DSM 16493]URF47916.1 SMP-30/gluconolactonase/LRE family protein [Dinoroseobacter shibae]URF52225.1 SMP-30/gluconolactonase/LRE family protein [Dinoroseobacter shibae]